MSAWTKYELGVAVWLVGIAYLEGDVAMNAALSQKGWKLLKNLRNADTDTNGYIALDGVSGIVALVFPGTQTWTNTKTDLDVVPENGLGVTLHGGFWKAYLSVAAAIDDVLSHNAVRYAKGDPTAPSAIRGGPVTLLVVGHSLGGALASIAAFDRTFQLYRQNVGLITFGSPRVGYADFVGAFENSMDRRCIRVVVNNDPIPLIPTSPYHHVGGLLHLSTDGKELGAFKKGWYAVVNWFKGIRRLMVDLVKWTEFRDHNLRYYQDAVSHLPTDWRRPL